MSCIIGTYKIINKKSNKFYYGSSKHIKKRFWRHKSELKHNKHHCIHLQRAYNKYGKENFEYIIDTVCGNIDEAINLEQYYIDENYGTLYNTSKYASGGDNISYHPQKSEIIKKMKISLKYRYNSMTSEERKNKYGMRGKKNPMYGKTHTIETRNKISSILKSKQMTGEKNSFYGKHH